MRMYICVSHVYMKTSVSEVVDLIMHIKHTLTTVHTTYISLYVGTYLSGVKSTSFSIQSNNQSLSRYALIDNIPLEVARGSVHGT